MENKNRGCTCTFVLSTQALYNLSKKRDEDLPEVQTSIGNIVADAALFKPDA